MTLINSLIPRERHLLPTLKGDQEEINRSIHANSAHLSCPAILESLVGPQRQAA
jgi:hypothetical protein